jgi:hypothetical protein
MQQNTHLMTVYRIENPVEKHGMWYNNNGVMQKKIHILCPNGIAKDLPMPLRTELHRKDGHVWLSAAKDSAVMNSFFHPQDAANLYNNGYKLFEFATTMFQVLEWGEVLFCRKGIVSQKEIPLETLWDIKDLIGS